MGVHGGRRQGRTAAADRVSRETVGTLPGSAPGSPGTARSGDTRPIRVCLVAPSLREPGGQSIQAARLARGLRQLGVVVGFVPIDPRLPGPLQLLQRVPAEYVLSAYPNAGYPKYHEGRFVYHTAPDDFARAAREMVAEGAGLIGGCCGTNPKHIAAINRRRSQLRTSCDAAQNITAAERR